MQDHSTSSRPGRKRDIMRGRMKRTSKSKAVTTRDVGKRWTPALVKNGWTPISDDFLRYYGTIYPEISNSEAMFIVQLMSWKWDEKKPYPGFKTVAKRMGISATQARAHARSLENKKYLKRIMRVGTTNRFDLTPLFQAIETEAKKHPKQKPSEDEEGDN